MREVVIFDVRHVKTDDVKVDWEALGVLPPKEEEGKELFWRKKTFYKSDISNVTSFENEITIITTYLTENFVVKGSFEEVCDKLFPKEKKNKKDKFKSKKR